ncbi:hypothetical protein KKC45_03360 [Patescibacteria group bacterium]|nr:hypothetical protein [Patescibacteria group bacterium]
MKKKIDLGITVEDVLKFFWLAKENGWASGKVDVKKDRFNPNLKRIVFQKERFFYQDKYWVTPVSNSSAGTTTILFLYNRIWIPVWWMSYGGEYPKEVIPFLKEALMENIRLKQFKGGRGRCFFENSNYPDLTYLNGDTGDFSSFRGRESIYKGFNISSTKKELGFHTYQGMSLI